MKVNVYIDGFNLYYGAVKGTPYRWLNLAEMCRMLLPRDQILQIKYFTALVNARAANPDQRSRPETLLRALATIPNLSIIYGFFLTHEIMKQSGWCVSCVFVDRVSAFSGQAAKRSTKPHETTRIKEMGSGTNKSTYGANPQEADTSVVVL